MDFEITQKITRIVLYFVPFLFSLSVHEFAHGWVALKRGDNTAKAAGRLSLSPLAHADLIGTFVLPLVSLWYGSPIFFGWATPVPINSRNLKNPRTDMFWIAAAGPMSNIIIALFSAFVFAFAETHFPGKAGEGTQAVFLVFIQLNLFLAFFNLIPVHPLDGGKVIGRFLPASWDYWMERNQNVLSMILLLLFLSGVMKILAIPIMATMEAFISFARLIV